MTAEILRGEVKNPPLSETIKEKIEAEADIAVVFSAELKVLKRPSASAHSVIFLAPRNPGVNVEGFMRNLVENTVNENCSVYEKFAPTGEEYESTIASAHFRNILRSNLTKGKGAVISRSEVEDIDIDVFYDLSLAQRLGEYILARENGREESPMSENILKGLGKSLNFRYFSS